MRSIIALGLLMAVGAGHAVHVNPNGTGQVLIYPLYRADGGYDTLLSVTNDSDRAKALVLRVQEGLLGQDVLNFHIYLKPFGTWTGAIAEVQSGVTGIIGGGTSCTVPTIPQGGQPFTDLLLSDDPAPNDLARLQYGMVEIIEMGELSGNAAELVDALDCSALIAAWSTGGFWLADIDTDMEPPGGGLSGSAWLVDVAEGLAYSYEATALDEFASQPLNAAPGGLKPDLGSATPQPNGTRTLSTVFTDDGPLNLLWSSPIDAVSAALTASAMATDFTLIESLNAQTAVWLTAPTFRHYVSALYAPTGDGGPFNPPTGQLPRPPFASEFGANGAPTDFQVDLVSRNGNAVDSCDTVSIQLPPSGIAGTPELVAAVNPIVLTNEVLFSSPSVANRIRASLAAGRVAFVFGPEVEGFTACNEVDHSGRVSAPAIVSGGDRDGQTVRLSGLPLLGVTLTQVANGTLTDGSGQAVLSNYGVEFQPRRKVVVID